MSWLVVIDVTARVDRTYLAFQLDLLIVAVRDVPLRQARLAPEDCLSVAGPELFAFLDRVVLTGDFG